MQHASRKYASTLPPKLADVPMKEMHSDKPACQIPTSQCSQTKSREWLISPVMISRGTIWIGTWQSLTSDVVFSYDSHFQVKDLHWNQWTRMACDSTKHFPSVLPHKVFVFLNGSSRDNCLSRKHTSLPLGKTVRLRKVVCGLGCCDCQLAVMTKVFILY